MTGPRLFLFFFSIAAAWPAVPAWAQARTAERAPCAIAGRVTSGGQALPGVALTIVPGERTETVATSTGLDGSYVVAVPAAGAYALRADLAGFAAVSRDLALAPEDCRVTADVEMVLESRAPKPAASAPSRPRAPSATAPSSTASPRDRAGRGAGRFQGLDVMPDATGEGLAETPDAASQTLLPPGFSADASTESLAVAGSGGQPQTVDALLFGDRQQWLEQAGGDVDALARRVAEGGLDGQTGGRGFPGGGPGGPGPGGGGYRGNFGGFNRSNRLQGSVYYDAAGSPFDARPFSLNGQPTEKADYFENRYGATLGGPVKIPGLYDGTSRTSFALNYSGAHTSNPYDAYSTVPTEEERAGDFSGLGATVYDPLTGEPFPENTIPGSRIDPSARALLEFLPLPNQAGLSQNFHFVTAAATTSDQITLRFNHLLSATPEDRSARPQGGRGGGGRRRPSVNAAVTYRRATVEDTPTFPTLGGSVRTSSWDVPVTISLPTGKVFHQIRLDYNLNRAQGENIFASVRDVAGEAGIHGASPDPLDWGVPNLSFTTLTSLRDRNPSLRRDQRFTVSDVATRSWGKHNLRFGGGFRTQRLQSDTDTNARGSFVFTGLYTAGLASGAPIPGTGSDFADFLLGRAQQASVQYGPGEVRFHGDAFNLFLQDDWRPRSNLTVNVGLRYEYVSPFQEQDDRLVNLDVPPDFTAASPVLAGQTGPFTGPFPASLVSSDWNNVAPRVGAAWKAKRNLTVRAGFGINYSLGAYPGIAQHLAGQPPFAVSNTLLGALASPLLLSDALTLPGSATTNSFGIDKGYALPAVLIWNFDVQRQLGSDLVVSVGYSGTRGYDLDLQRAPNRGPEGLRIPDVAPFIWESSGATSILHSGTLRLRKRLTHGFGGGFTYTFSKSIDDASSIGGGAVVVAQNDQDLAAERGLSSFDRRHNLSGDWLLELPIGPGRKWLREGALASVIGGWVWSGTLSFQSGTPFTARVLGSFGDVARGVNGTLRASVTGEGVVVPDPNIERWFNTGAFVVPPPGAFGDVGRNTVIGPSTFLVNMGLIKNISLGRPRTLSLRVQANNVFNTPPLLAIDTAVNSPTYGQVVQAGGMRSLQFETRFRF